MTPRSTPAAQLPDVNGAPLDALRVAAAPHGITGNLQLIPTGLDDDLCVPVALPLAIPLSRRRRLRRRDLNRRAWQPASGLHAGLRLEEGADLGPVRRIH